MDKLVTALSDRSLSPLDRLKVACYLWENRYEPRKILRWTCDQICTTDKKKSQPSSEYEELSTQLFRFLSVVLTKTTDVQLRLEDSLFTAHLLNSMTETLLIDSNECTKSVVECLEYTMTGSPLPSVLFKIDLVVPLLHNLLLTTMKSKMLALLFPLVPFFQFFVYLQGSQGNQKKVFTLTCELLGPLLSVRKLLSEKKTGSKNGEVITQLDNVLQQMFNRDTLPEFPSAVSSSDWFTSSSKQTATSFVRVLFSSLHSIMCSDPGCPYNRDSQAKKIVVKSHTAEMSVLVGCEGVPVILQTFLIQTSQYEALPKAVEFKFFQRLFEILSHSHHLVPEQTEDSDTTPLSETMQSLAGHYVKELSEPSPPSESLTPPLQALSKCLDLLFEHEVYNVGEDRSSGGEQVAFFEQLAHNLLQLTTQDNLEDVLLCLTSLLQLNHKVVEPWLPLIWLYLSTDTLKGEGFTEVCIATYWKLRQLPLLMKTYLKSMDLLANSLSDHPTSLPSCPSLTLSTERLLTKHVSSLPPGQYAEILDVFYTFFTQKLDLGLDMKKSGVYLSDPLIINLVPSLEKAADVLSLILGGIPMSVWSGQLKEKVVAVLLKLHREVCLPLLEATYTKKCRKRISSLALTLTCATSQVLSPLDLPDLTLTDWLPELIWHAGLSLAVPAVWSSWLPSSIERIGPIRFHLLKRLSITALKATLRRARDEDVSFAVLSVLQPLTEEKGSSSVWSGQTLDLRAENSEVAHWHLLLSHIHFFYTLIPSEHIKALGSDIVATLLGSKEASTPSDGLTVRGVLRDFLSSEAFLEMASLQEAVLSSVLSHGLSSFPKCFKPMVKSLPANPMRSEEAFLDDPFCESLSACLNGAVDLCRKLGKRPPKNWTDKLTTCLELIESLPLRYLSPVSLQRILLSVCAWHTTLAFTVMYRSDTDNAHPLLLKVSYLLAYVLHCLSLCPLLNHTPKSSKSKRQSVMAHCAKFTELLDLVHEWLFISGLDLVYPGHDRVLQVCMEIIIDVRVKVGGTPSMFVAQLGDCVENPAVAEWMYCIVLASCKYYQQIDPNSKRPRPELDQLLEVTLSLLDGAIHPLLVSALAALVRCQPDLISTRVISTVQAVEEAAGDPSQKKVDPLFQDDHSEIEIVYHRIYKLNALIDSVCLSARLPSKETTEGDQTVTNICKAWNILQSALTCLCQLSLCPQFSLCLGQVPNPIRTGTTRELVLKNAYDKVAIGMKEVLSLCDREELFAMLDELEKLDHTDSVSVCVFCASWRLVLDSKLKQPCREGLRRHYSKVVSLCGSAAHALSINVPLVTGLVQLVTSLASLPSQAGLDNQSVMVCLQMCSILKGESYSEAANNEHLSRRIGLLGAIAEMMLAVCRQHTSAINSSPAPVITALIKLLQEVISTGQDIDQQLSANNDSFSKELPALVHCASVVSRALELISQQVIICKYVVYILHEYIVAAYSRPLHSQVRDSLLPGVVNLVRLASPGDIAFLKSPMDSITRENCQMLLDQYNQYYKFGGKI